jgi:hypothetical protein
MMWAHCRKDINKTVRRTLPFLVVASVIVPLHAKQTAPTITTNVSTTECDNTARRPL